MDFFEFDWRVLFNEFVDGEEATSHSDHYATRAYLQIDLCLAEFIDTGAFSVKHHLQLGFVWICVQILSQLAVHWVSLYRLIVLKARFHLQNIRFVLSDLLIHVVFLRFNPNISVFYRISDEILHVFCLFCEVFLSLF